MKVLQINATFGNGSTGKIVQDIHKMLLSNGIESYVAYSVSDVSQRDVVNGYKIGCTIEKKAHALLCRISGKQAYYSYFSTTVLLKQIKNINPDVVHLHNLHSNYINLNMLLSFLAKEKIRTVVTLHDSWFYTGGCFNYSAAGCYRWLESCGNCPQRLIGTPSLFFDASKKILLDRKKYLLPVEDLCIVGVSKWITSEAQRTFLNDKKCYTVYNGIDLSFFKPVESNLKFDMGLQDKFIILGFANKWLKDINLEVFDELCKSLTEDMAFLIVGDIGSRKLPKNVINIPYIDNRQRLREIYSLSDVFANCTREDSFSLVNVEAQACGTPVITFANTGANETVSDSYGFHVKDGDAHSFVECIFEVLNKGKERFSEGCIAFVMKNFDNRANYKKYLEVYNYED